MCDIRKQTVWQFGEEVVDRFTPSIERAWRRQFAQIRRSIAEVAVPLALAQRLNEILKMDGLGVALSRSIGSVWRISAQRSAGTAIEALAITADRYATSRAFQLTGLYTDQARSAIRRTLQVAIVNNWTAEQTTRALKAVVALPPRQRDIVLRADPGPAMSQAGRARENARLRAIAQTELNRARNLGTLGAWAEQNRQGDLGSTPKKEWVTVGPCPLCQDIAAQGPIPLGQQFAGGFDSPPAHINCRCSLRLVV